MGNSITKPGAFVKVLLWWLYARCSQKFTFIGRKLLVGSQRDTTCCGFFAMNAISHGIFSTNLLTHKDLRENWLTWLNNFCKAIAQQVIPPPFSKKVAMLTVHDA